MLKLLLIIALTVYVISRLGRFFSLFNAPRSMETPPNPVSPRERKRPIKGGEYVDFEEVK